MDWPSPSFSDGLRASLAVTGRCKHTGGLYVCVGHVDFFGSYMVWTRHTQLKTTLYRVIPYDHPAPETIPTERT